MMRRQIKNVQAGRGVTIYGRITEIDQAPITVSVGSDNRLTPLFHATLTDEETSISCTVWDRVAEFSNFRLGEKVMLSNVTVKRVTGFFAEYGQYSVNFGKGSVVSTVPADMDSSMWKHESVRVPTQATDTRAPAHTDVTAWQITIDSPTKTNTPSKRTRDSTTSSKDCTATCSECDAPNEPFCEATGKPHDARCTLCKKVLSRVLFCGKTGLPH